MILSVVARRLRGVTPNLWRGIAEDRPEVRVEYVDLGERWEQTRWEPGGAVVCLHEGLLHVQRRYAIAHACEHLDRGVPCRTFWASIEARVVAATARWLLFSLDKIASVLAAYDLRAAASETVGAMGCVGRPAQWAHRHRIGVRAQPTRGSGMTDYEEQMLELAEAQLIAQRRSATYLGVLAGVTITLLGISIVAGVLGLIVGLHS